MKLTKQERENLIMEYYDYVKNGARYEYNNTKNERIREEIDLDDYIQEAMEALVVATKIYDPNNKNKASFKTFLVNKIKNHHMECQCERGKFYVAQRKSNRKEKHSIYEVGKLEYSFDKVLYNNSDKNEIMTVIDTLGKNDNYLIERNESLDEILKLFCESFNSVGTTSKIATYLLFKGYSNNDIQELLNIKSANSVSRAYGKFKKCFRTKLKSNGYNKIPDSKNKNKSVSKSGFDIDLILDRYGLLEDTLQLVNSKINNK